MFSTALEKATSFFDRRVLLSIFFPTLLFWLLAVVLVALTTLGLKTTMMLWNNLSGTIQAILLIAFFAWIVFWSFLTLNVRALLFRLYEGYWSTSGLSAVLLQWRRHHWQKRWDRLTCRDEQLEQREDALLAERESYQQLPLPSSSQTYGAHRSSQGSQQKEPEIDAHLAELETTIRGYEVHKPSVDVFLQSGKNIRLKWKNTASLLPLIHKQTYDDAHNKLTMLKAKLVALASRQFEETQEQRLWLNRTLTLYYPPQRTSMLPTRLGNVLKAAEMYTTERYHLDAVLIWSRLQPLLPEKFTDGLQDAEISLNIMVILSSACLFFGIPLSLLVGFKWDMSLFWWLPLMLTLLALLLQAYPVLIFALFALFLDGIVSVSSHTPLLVRHIADIFFLSACSVLFSWVSYQNAVQSALAYGEQVKVAFDLYRWKVLDELHLQLPVDYSNEQKIWDEVCALLARSYQPDTTVYRYRQPEQTNTSSPSP